MLSELINKVMHLVEKNREKNMDVIRNFCSRISFYFWLIIKIHVYEQMNKKRSLFEFYVVLIVYKCICIQSVFKVL